MNNRKLKQPFLDDKLFKAIPKEFGGELLNNSHPKTKRPISTKDPMHIVLRSGIAKGELSLLCKGRSTKIMGTIYRIADRYDIKIYDIAVNFNHLHILLKLKYRDSYSPFIRSISGIISRLVLNARKGKAKLDKSSMDFKKFWLHRPFSRIMNWGRDFDKLKSYIRQNILESLDIIEYKQRRNLYKFSTSPPV
jgi:REP element-mobilizing transposase RayT